ncbi:hypothetical protein FE236_00730 [Mariprofundus erugo]|uniref:SPOR domain-containing protein n=1 Tax=Mariprofundus erugo TaxID=2528639 RepID=A0A5R9GSP3_9PROT|nr:hypothetical protein [Mariprofundus erugo]TLS66264.1 hypothetical protein FEF65_10625 [Mariprofundus erugo]TLS78315.1 hypothetical protein FE236_00730 [Mariprofundus erugo]
MRGIRRIYWLLCSSLIMAMPAHAEELAPQGDWVNQGWEQLVLRHPDQALKIWQTGVNSQPDSHLFAVLGAYSLLTNAMQKLEQIGPSYQTFITRTSNQAGQPLYFVLSARYVPENREQRRKELADLQQAAEISGSVLASAASRFKLDDLTTLETPASAGHSSQADNAWLLKGWEQIDQFNTDEALRTWQQGINALDDHRLLASLGVFSKQENALTKIKQIGREQQVFIALRQRGKALYYVLSALPVPADVQARQTALAELKQAAHISSKLLAVSPADFKNPDIQDHFPEIIFTSPAKAAHAPASPTADSTPLINRFEVTGNQQISTDTIIMELREFFDMPNSSETRNLIRLTVAALYRDTGMEHIGIDIPADTADETVRIHITEDQPS